MDRRDFLLDLLKKYKSFDKDEEVSRINTLNFIKDNLDCFNNDYSSGHITGSALVVDKKIEYTLLTLHTAFDKWFQFGGHSDGHYNPIEVAWREAEEESGLTSLEYFPDYEGIFDLDIHPIPENNQMPLHYHYDVRILLSADMNEPFIVSSESKELKWVKLTTAKKYNNQTAFLRLIAKAVKVKDS